MQKGREGGREKEERRLRKEDMEVGGRNKRLNDGVPYSLLVYIIINLERA